MKQSYYKKHEKISAIKICDSVGKNYKYSDITRSVIGCAMRVHSELGNGFQEVIYQRCLAIEFQEENISNARELTMPLFYKNQEVGSRRVGFLVEDKVLVELRAVSEIDNTHYNQVLNYLTAYKLEVGLLINFGESSLNFKRFINSKIADCPDLPDCAELAIYDYQNI